LSAALVAGCAFYAFGSGTAQASSVEIVGGATPSSFPGYGTASGNNNVINYAPSKVTDPFTGAAPNNPGSSFIGSTSGSMAVVETSASVYTVDWWFVGAESGFNNTLVVANPVGPFTGSFTEHNENSNCCSSGTQGGPQFLGTSTGNTQILDFTVKDDQGGVGVTNGVNNSAPLVNTRPSLVFSYVTPTLDQQGNPLSWTLSKVLSDWILFAYNDTGGPDDNHDDFVGILRVNDLTPPPVNGQTPIPGAGWLLGSVIGLGVGAFRLRRRGRRMKAA
jgi:hypothetical protein